MMLARCLQAWLNAAACQGASGALNPSGTYCSLIHVAFHHVVAIYLPIEHCADCCHMLSMLLLALLILNGRNRAYLYDRPAANRDRVLLGTGLVWRQAPPCCRDSEVAAVVRHMPAVEVYGAVPAAGQQDAE